MLKVIEKTKIWFSISLIIIVIGLGFAITKGFNYGIDFSGGTAITINMGKDFNKADIEAIAKKYAKDYVVTKSNENGKIQADIKSNQLDDTTITKLFDDVKTKYKLKGTDLSQERISGTIGKELKVKAIQSLSVAIILILLYIGFRFEFKFGIAAIISLVHDVLITLSVYAVFRIPIDTPFIAAMLTIVGYSITDTVVVFDRIRENQKKLRGISFGELANKSITQTIHRSIYTVLTVLIAITSVHIFVSSVRNFTTPLIVGIVSGCYSSIFIASPLWVIFKNRSKKVNVMAK